MRLLPVWALLAFLSTDAAPAATSAPAFTCQDAEASYEIFIGEDQNRLRINKPNQATREILLTGANSDGPRLAGPLTYLGYNPKGEDISSTFLYAHEFTVQYRTSDDSTQVVVSLVIDNREHSGLRCRASGIAATVIPADRLAPARTRHAALLIRSSRQRERDGVLSVYGIQGTLAAIRRFIASPDFASPSGRAAFARDTREAVRELSLASVNVIMQSLPKPAAQYWRELLKAVQYRYAPESVRYAAWVKEGIEDAPEPDRDSVIAGLNAFVHSNDFSQKDIRAYFTKEVQPSVRKLSPDDATKVLVFLDPPAKSYLTELVGAGPSPLPGSAGAEVQRVAAELGVLLQKPPPEPRKIAERLDAFLKSPLGRDRRAQNMLVAAVGPQFRKLTPRQREDLLGWCEGFSAQALVLRLTR